MAEDTQTNETDKEARKRKFKAAAAATSVIASGISDALNHVVHKGDQVNTGSNIQDTGEPRKDKFNYDPYGEEYPDKKAEKERKAIWREGDTSDY